MAGVEGAKGMGNFSKCLYIYHPTKNTFQKPDLPPHIIKLYYMVGKIQFRVTCYCAMPYGMENPVQGVGTKKPRTLDTWLNSMFVMWCLAAR
jgi:hypothetical protein